MSDDPLAILRSRALAQLSRHERWPMAHCHAITVDCRELLALLDRVEGVETEPEPFVLDLAENPHPRMLRGALDARRAANGSLSTGAYWRGYLSAMCDATGETPEAIWAWLDRHEDQT